MRIIILGGGFCGSLIVKNLDRKRNVEVILIDKKEYFEYSPSIWKLLLKPEKHKKYIASYSRFLKNVHMIKTSMLHVTPEFIETEKEKIMFDYLVISTGIEYPISLENQKNIFIIKDGGEVVIDSKKISNANTILIIGGGLIGTEIAGELVTASPKKNIILVHSHDRLLERNREMVSSYATKFLMDRGVRIILGESVIDHQNGTFSTNKKRIIKADVGIWCAGISSNPWFMSGFNSSIFTKKNALKVNNFLQLEGYPNIFVGGDITSIDEEKTAINAMRHGALILSNILRSIQRKRLLIYRSRKAPMIISLGRHNAILSYWLFMIPGPIPSVIKYLLEKIDMKRLK